MERAPLAVWHPLLSMDKSHVEFLSEDVPCRVLKNKENQPDGNQLEKTTLVHDLD